jgi:hypothetical protein
VATASRVGQDEVGATGVSPADGIVNNGSGIRSFGTANNVGSGPLGPHRELVGRGGSEGVTGGEDDRASAGHLGRRHLADRRRLTDPIHPHEEPDGDAAIVGRGVERTVTGLEEGNQLGAQGRHQAVGRSIGPEVFENLLGSRNTHVTSQEYFFDEFELPGRECAPPAG